MRLTCSPHTLQHSSTLQHNTETLDATAAHVQMPQTTRLQCNSGEAAILSMSHQRALLLIDPTPTCMQTVVRLHLSVGPCLVSTKGVLHQSSRAHTIPATRGAWAPERLCRKPALCLSVHVLCTPKAVPRMGDVCHKGGAAEGTTTTATACATTPREHAHAATQTAHRQRALSWMPGLVGHVLLQQGQPTCQSKDDSVLKPPRPCPSGCVC